MSKELTKIQKFNLEMVYKPTFSSEFKKVINHISIDDILKDDHLFLEEFSIEMNCFFKDNLDKIFEFIDLYKDCLTNNAWMYIVSNNHRISHLMSRETIVSIAERYESYMTKNCWDQISNVIRNNDDFVRNYKDKLNWKRLCKTYRFTEDFLIEMEDYIDLKNCFNNSNFSKKTKLKLIKYLQNHIEEALNETN